MILDWREMAGRPTTSRALPGEGPWKAWNAVWSGGKEVGLGSAQNSRQLLEYNYLEWGAT